MIIVDSHCHLDMLQDKTTSEAQQRQKVDDIVQRAKESNVAYLQTICTRLDNFANILGIAKNYDNVFASVGVHPSEVDKDIATSKQLLELASDEKVIGFGETGLDYFYNKDDSHQALQRLSFENHIEASQKSSEPMPIIVHTRDADDDTASIISSNMKHKAFPALIHCFTASEGFARKMLDLGVYISVSGIVTFKNARELQDIVKFLPLDRILVETDSPYLAPVPHRGKTNEPGFTRHVVEFIADLKEISSEKVAAATTDNFFNLFSKSRI